MSRFGSDPHTFFSAVYRETAPWDIGAQPALLAMLDRHPPTGPVLDVGCGSGDLAFAVARRGVDVRGVDFVDAAIELARSRAPLHSPEVASRVEFRIGDALRPSTLGRQFGAVVDSGFYHLFDRPQVELFAADLATALIPGGRYYVLAFSVTFPVRNIPRGISEDELREIFTPAAGWRILECGRAEFQSRVVPVPAIAACIERC